jgi:hypothetical protein
MCWLKLCAALAITAWSLTSQCDDLGAQPVAPAGGLCDTSSMPELRDLSDLVPKLSGTAKVYFPSL